MLRRFVLLAALLTAACHGDTSGPPNDTPTTPQLLRVRGQGAVSQRYSAELTTLGAGSRGTFVYTSTWGRRGQGPCDVSNCGNVVYVWNATASGTSVVD